MFCRGLHTALAYISASMTQQDQPHSAVTIDTTPPTAACHMQQYCVTSMLGYFSSIIMSEVPGPSEKSMRCAVTWIRVRDSSCSRKGGRQMASLIIFSLLWRSVNHTQAVSCLCQEQAGTLEVMWRCRGMEVAKARLGCHTRCPALQYSLASHPAVKARHVGRKARQHCMTGSGMTGSGSCWQWLRQSYSCTVHIHLVSIQFHGKD